MREELPLLLQNTLNAHGAQTLSVSKFIPSIVAGLSDSQVIIALKLCYAADPRTNLALSLASLFHWPV